MMLFLIVLSAITAGVSSFEPIFFPKLYNSRQKRDGIASTRWISRTGGIDVPLTLRSLITCLTPGINDLICLGPRVGLFEPRKVTLTEQDGASFGYNNGIDLRFLKSLNVPLVGKQTNIGHHIGATVSNNKVEFGPQLEILKAYRHNVGGVVEYGPDGAALDLGQRINIGDDAVKIRITDFGLNVNPMISPYTDPVQQASNTRQSSTRSNKLYNTMGEQTVDTTSFENDVLPRARGLQQAKVYSTNSN